MSDWKPGEPITARKLNAHSASRAQVDMSGPPGSFSKFGQNWAATQADLTNTGMWIRVTGNPVDDQYIISESVVQTAKLHSWEAIYWNEGKKMWSANPAAYGNASSVNNTIYDYDAVIAPDFGSLKKTTDASITANNTNQTNVTPYFAVRDPVSRRLIAVNTSGNFNATSSETVLMILGTYDEYKDCPNVPGKPPTIKDFCGEDTGELCVPAYAYAVYQRCGYIWKKIGDTRDYQVWANEMNGGGFSAWRRFVIPRWGGALSAVGPNPADDCIGVAFLGVGPGAALTCNTCAPCLTSPPEGACLEVKFRTMPRPVEPPEDPVGCGYLWHYMDENDLWDKDITLPILAPINYCNVGSEGSDLFDFEWQSIDGSDLECDWGPDEFDPCDPCRHWSRIFASIGVAFGDSGANCGGAGQWTGEFLARDICNLLCDCDTGPVKPVATKVCNNCGNSATPPAPWHVIKEDSVELICCPSDSILGGDAFSSPPDGYSGGNSTTSYDAFYGGEA